jgi:hypothetical protein
MPYCENPPPWLQLVQNHPRLFRLNGVDWVAVREASAELYHALGQANLSQPLVALLLRDIIGGAFARAVTFSLGLCVDRSIIDYLVIHSRICGSQARIVDGEEAKLRWPG